MIGPIRGNRLPAEIKLQILRAVDDAKAKGLPVERACEVIMIDPRRLRRWLAAARTARVNGSNPSVKTPLRGSQAASSRPACLSGPLWGITAASLADRPPVARVSPHRLAAAERAEILAAADEDRHAHLRHRKLTHELSRQGRVFCSESTVLRVLRDAGKVPRYVRRHRPERRLTQQAASRPNAAWDYDFTDLPTVAGPYHLAPVLDRCSRKIVGRYFGPEATSYSVQTAWGKSLANEALLAEDGPELPEAHSDRGTQMTSKSTQAFFNDLGITQTFSRARTPTDNAAAESWMATLKCERLYDADTSEMSPPEVEAMIDRFIWYYNNVRLHQSIGFVTPQERHEGRHLEIIRARKEGMRRAREQRRRTAYEGTGEGGRS